MHEAEKILTAIKIFLWNIFGHDENYVHLLTSQIEIHLHNVPYYSVNKALMMVSLYTDRTCVLMFSQIFAALFGSLRGDKHSFKLMSYRSLNYFSYTSIK